MIRFWNIFFLKFKPFLKMTRSLVWQQYLCDVPGPGIQVRNNSTLLQIFFLRIIWVILVSIKYIKKENSRLTTLPTCWLSQSKGNRIPDGRRMVQEDWRNTCWTQFFRTKEKYWKNRKRSHWWVCREKLPHSVGKECFLPKIWVSTMWLWGTNILVSISAVQILHQLPVEVTRTYKSKLPSQ